MKTVRLFIVALFLTVAASAQPNASSARDGSSPTVYMISVQETDTLIPCEWRARAARNRMAMMDAVDDYNQTHRTGFQQPGRPQFLFAHKQNKYSLALGGFIALRTSYDFDGTPSATTSSLRRFRFRAITLRGSGCRWMPLPRASILKVSPTPVRWAVS